MSMLSKYNKMKLMRKELNIGYISLIYHIIFKKNEELKIPLKDGSNTNIKAGYLPNLAKLLSNGWKVLAVEDGLLTLEGNNDIIITCRTGTGFDLGHLIEIYVDKSYGYNPTGKNIIDIGMSNGDSSIYFAKNGAKKVVGIEPDKRSFNLAVRNIQSSKVDTIVIPLNKALALNDQNVELIVYEDSPNGNSIDAENMVKLESEKHIEVVEGITLKKVLDIFNSEPIDLLKMDCEGCEYAVLNNSNKEIFAKIKALEMEFHNGIQNLPEILKENGFTIDVSNSDGLVGYIRAKKENRLHFD
jgi:FkbM family methyltransferase